MASEKKEVPNGMKLVFRRASGMTATCFVHPLDLIKTRMQISGMGTAKKEYRSIFHAARTIFAQESFFALYNGLSAGLLRQATYSSTRLGVYTWLFSFFSKMVLESKTGVGHNDYGSIGGGGGGGGGGETGGSSGGGMTQSDLYQRQPLLSAGTGTWPNGASPQATTNFYRDDDEDKDDDDDLKRIEIVNANGSIRIEMPGPHREEPRFPKEKWKTFIAFLFLLANFILTTTSLAVVHERVPDNDPPLPDAVLDAIPSTPWALDISEIIIMISTNITFLVIFFHKHRFIVFRRVFLIVAVLYMMRSLTMYVTVLPMASKAYYCSPKANSTSVLLISKRVFQLMSGFGLSINGKHTYCGDFIYSGHTVVLIMCSLIISEYSPKRFKILHWGSWTASLIGVVLVLVARGHYTVDVLIAYFVTTRLFWMYHTLANHKYLKQSTSRNHLSRVWWFRAFCYFEANVEGPVPRQYNWPLPWPRKLLAKHPNRDSEGSQEELVPGKPDFLRGHRKEEEEPSSWL